MREYSYYYAPKKVKAHNTSVDPATVVTGVIYFGIRAQDLLLSNSAFYKRCGLWLLSDIEALSTGGLEPVTSLIISNTNDAQRINTVYELTFTLIPVDPARTLNPYNTRYNTGTPCSSLIPQIEMAERLLEARFTFSSGGQDYIYRVEPTSIKEKRQKKSAPTL